MTSEETNVWKQIVDEEYGVIESDSYFKDLIDDDNESVLKAEKEETIEDYFKKVKKELVEKVEREIR